MTGIQSRRSLLGIPPNAAVELYKQDIDPVPYLSVRGRMEFEALTVSDLPKPVGCIEAVLGLPGLKQIRKALPVGFKEKVKGVVKIMIGDKIEP